MTDLYDELGVPKDADKAAIKRAYRSRAKKVHPDTPGGDEAKFRQLSTAFRILSDDEKREHYDKTGQTDDPPDNTMAEVMSIVNRAIDAALAREDVLSQPLFEMCESGIWDSRAEVKRQIAKTKVVQERLEKVRKKIRFRGKGEDLVTRGIDARLEQLRRALAGMERNVELLTKALDVLKDYTFDRDMGMQPTSTASATFFRGI